MELERFIEAQKNVYGQALTEIRNGKKATHWMWFIFPQIKGLGTSPTANFYAIKDIAEARQYLENKLLEKRLIEISTALLELNGLTAEDIFGYPDYLKLQSSMTLFDLVGDTSIFREVLDKYYQGKPDAGTLKLLNKYSD